MMGCYTRFAQVDWQSVTPDDRPSAANTASGSSEKAGPVDTLKTDGNETCVWERDLMGFPYLRCYKGFYPREWYRNNFTPWWYQTDAYFYDRGRCPEYYYYDENCGCCRYYLNNPELTRTSRRNARSHANESSSGPAPNPAGDTTNRVSVSASTHTTVTIPISHGGASSSSSTNHQVAAKDSSAQKGAQVADSSGRPAKVSNDSTQAENEKQATGSADPPKTNVVPQEKKPRRTMRGR
jgi:hypothetical protein